MYVQKIYVENNTRTDKSGYLWEGKLERWGARVEGRVFYTTFSILYHMTTKTNFEKNLRVLLLGEPSHHNHQNHYFANMPRLQWVIIIFNAKIVNIFTISLNTQIYTHTHSPGTLDSCYQLHETINGRSSINEHFS